MFDTSSDYEQRRRDAAILQIVQNKLHFAVNGKTAAELLSSRADHKKPFMGLTTWKARLGSED